MNNRIGKPHIRKDHHQEEHEKDDHDAPKALYFLVGLFALFELSLNHSDDFPGLDFSITVYVQSGKSLHEFWIKPFLAKLLGFNAGS